MKILLRLNFFALGLPIAIAMFSFLNPGLLILALLSTMITGGLQVFIALIMFVINPYNVHLYIYASITIIFFILWRGLDIEGWVFLFPLLLSIYLTYIVAEEYKKTRHEPETKNQLNF